TIFLVVVVLGWAPAARYARALARDALGAPYTRAAYAMGFSTAELSRHVLLPLCIRQVISAKGAILVEIFVLDFALTLFGFGPSPPFPTLGGLISDGLRFFTVAPWTILTPLVSLCAVCVSLRMVLQGVGVTGVRLNTQP
ncbi:MAG TPA: ABC transporter permease subunit, partial [Blastocatellia bacterium]|nr:ABC transporter permease subunit [Blastocatellia bacterium]